MAKKIIWTIQAKEELIEILQYWINRNKSKSFSIKLDNLIQEQLSLILEFPKLGRLTDIPNVRIKIIHKYLLYYEFVNETLFILTIRHKSTNPKAFGI